MPQLSPLQLAPCMANVETTYGTQPATFSPANQGFLTMASPIALRPDFRYQDIRPHANSFTKQKRIPTTALRPVNFRFPLTGGTGAAAGFRQGVLFEAAGWKATVGASIAYALAPLADIKSITLAQEWPGYAVGVASESVVIEANGVFGNIRLIGTAAEGLYGEFAGLGLFQDPQETTLKTAYGGGTTAWSGGANNANKFILSSGNRIKLNNGGSDYFPVCSRFEFDFGVEVTAIEDINSGATFGIFTELITDRNPTIRLTLGLDTLAAANVSYQDLEQDAQDGTTHAINVTYTDLGGRTIAIAAPTAQVVGVEPAAGNKVRDVVVTYHVQSATAEGEATITHA